MVERLHGFGITGPSSILAHCIHIDAWEMALVRETGAFVSHQPRSNMNNAVGAAAVDGHVARRHPRLSGQRRL